MPLLKKCLITQKGLRRETLAIYSTFCHFLLHFSCCFLNRFSRSVFSYSLHDTAYTRQQQNKIKVDQSIFRIAPLSFPCFQFDSSDATKRSRKKCARLETKTPMICRFKCFSSDSADHVRFTVS